MRKFGDVTFKGKVGEAEAHTSNFEMKQYSSFYTYSNDGASGAITATLPQAIAGRQVNVIVAEEQSLTVKAQSGDLIWTGSLSGVGSISCSDKGGFVILTAINNGEWFASTSRTWS